MKKIYLSILLLFSIGANAQTITTVSSGLTGPAGICMDGIGNLFVAETGMGNNDGKISMIDPGGNRYTIVYNLPSFLDTNTHEVSGPWRPYIMNDSILWVVVGGGPDPSAGSLIQFNIGSLMPGMDSVDLTSSTDIVHIQTWVMGQGFSESNPFSAVWDTSGNIFAADAGANAVLKIDTGGNITIVDTFPAFTNPSGSIPPFIDYVPTKLISDMNGGYLLCNLTGFPFLTGQARVVSIDSLGTVTQVDSGLSQCVDMEADANGNIYVLQFALFDSTFAPTMNTASIVMISTGGTMDTLATGFGPSSGMTMDGAGGFYVTELFTGNVLHITDINGVENVIADNVHLNVYPSPFTNKISLNYSLTQKGNVAITLTDYSGRVIYTSVEGVKETGNYSKEINVNDINASLSSGIYYLTVSNGNSKKSISLIKQ